MHASVRRGVSLETIRRSADVTLALAGNPNVGKSSLFNQLTGLGVVTANYPGKTVEINFGRAEVDGVRLGIVDLPGIYALGAVSEDQWVARQALLDLHPDAVVAVVDAANLARNLYLVLQLLDLELPVVVALNLVDEARRQGIRTAPERLSDLLGVPVVATVASRGEGVGALVRAAVALAGQQRSPRGASPDTPRYGRDVEEVIAALARAVKALADGTLPHELGYRALAIGLLEEDVALVSAVKE